MGLTFLDVEVGNPADTEVFESVEFLIDSGAIFSIIPTDVLEKLGVKPNSEEEFFLANGEKIIRKKGTAFFRLDKRQGGAEAIFGETGDSNLLGALTLEALGLGLDPLKRELKPLPMIIGGWQISPNGSS